MITLKNVTKYFLTTKGRHYVLRDVNLSIGPRERLGVLGKNGAGKSTLMRLFAGVDIPNYGTIERYGSISWPMGLATGLQGLLTGRENAKFACRIQGVKQDRIQPVLEFVQEMADIGDYFEMPVRTYSSGMRARLNFAIAMSFDFDFYIIDELTSVGDQAFRTRSRKLFDQKRENSGFIKVSHNLQQLRRECDTAILLNDGELTYFGSIKDGIEEYKRTVVTAERQAKARKTAQIRAAKKAVAARLGRKPALITKSSTQSSEVSAQTDGRKAARRPHKPAPMMPRRPTTARVGDR